MDRERIRETALAKIGKYKYAILILLVGVMLMSFPSPKTQEAQPKEEAAPVEVDLQKKLEAILSQLAGAGNVRVLLTEATGEEICYQSDESANGTESLKKETVLISDGQRAENGLIRQVNPPRYLGAVVLCQGAGNPDVCFSISKAVASATGLSFDKIVVLKMK